MIKRKRKKSYPKGHSQNFTKLRLLLTEIKVTTTHTKTKAGKQDDPTCSDWWKHHS